MDCSPPGSSVRGSLQARTLEWVAISFSRGTSRPRNWTRISSIAGRFFTRTELSGKTDTYVVTRCREVPALPATLLRGLSQRQSRDWRTHTESGYSSLCRWRKALTWATEILLEWSLNSAWERMHFAQSVTRQSSCTSTLYRPVGVGSLAPPLWQTNVIQQTPYRRRAINIITGLPWHPEGRLSHIWTFTLAN